MEGSNSLWQNCSYLKESFLVFLVYCFVSQLFIVVFVIPCFSFSMKKYNKICMGCCSKGSVNLVATAYQFNPCTTTQGYFNKVTEIIVYVSNWWSAKFIFVDIFIWSFDVSVSIINDCLIRLDVLQVLFHCCKLWYCDCIFCKCFNNVCEQLNYFTIY